MSQNTGKFTRNPIFDIVRGFAVICMVVANAAPLYMEEFPFIFRIIFSLAAPIFVIMSGLMVAQIIHKHKYSYFCIKGAFIFCVGILVDIFIFQIKPLGGFDVLYLIGFSLPVVAFLARYSKKTIFISIITILITGVLLRKFIGYNELVNSSDVNFAAGEIFSNSIPLQHWFIDGWFPIFPWMSYMLVGLLIGKFYKESNDKLFFEHRKVLLTNISIFIIGIILSVIIQNPMYVRDGYNEIFYPANLGISFLLVGFSLITLSYGEYLKKYVLIEKILGSLGRGVLGVYVLHQIIIGYVIKPIFGQIHDLTIYMLIYFVHIVLLIAITLLLTKLKTKYTNLPLIVYWVIGK